MINGHGDDGYRYPRIVADFSSNICPGKNYQLLMAYLATRPELLGHYPEPDAGSLQRAIAEKEGIDPECVIVTGGATDAIYLLASIFVVESVIPQPTFSEYEDATNLFGAKRAEHSVIWICNPNNPTGDVYQQHDIERMLDDHLMVVIDQSYEDYTDEFVMTARQATATPRVIQLHSFSKSYGVPGLRLGYITASKEVTAYLRSRMRPWSVSALAVEAGKFLLEHDELRCRPDLNEAQRLRDRLSQIPHVLTQETKTNFMLCQLEAGRASDLKEYLARQHGLLIRDASNFKGLTQCHFRVAAQSPREDDALVDAIGEYVRMTL